MQVEQRPKPLQRFQQVIADETVRKAQAGDMQAHTEIYNLYSTAVLTLARGFCRNQQCAEDVVHNTFVQLINKVSTFQFRAPFGMWLRQIAVNESLIYLRKQKKHNSVYSTDDENFFETRLDYEVSVSEGRGSHSCGQDVAKEHNTKYTLSKVLQDLPEHARLVLWLKEIEGYTHEEIAEVVQKTPSYSKSIVARSYKYLRSRVAAAEAQSGYGQPV